MNPDSGEILEIGHGLPGNNGLKVLNSALRHLNPPGMKKIIFSFLSACGIFACGVSSQQKEVPEKVRYAFHHQFPGTTDVEWSNEGGGEYEAEFTMDGKERSATFSVDGVLKEIETEVRSEDVPSEVMNTIGVQFSGFKIKEIESVQLPDSTIYYEFELKNGAAAKEVRISGDGKILKQEDDDRDEDDAQTPIP
jgi:uncharacterized membrane protein YkoI